MALSDWIKFASTKKGMFQKLNKYKPASQVFVVSKELITKFVYKLIKTKVDLSKEITSTVYLSVKKFNRTMISFKLHHKYYIRHAL